MAGAASFGRPRSLSLDEQNTRLEARASANKVKDSRNKMMKIFGNNPHLWSTILDKARSMGYSESDAGGVEFNI